MFGRLVRVTGTVLVIAAAFVTPALITSAPAGADTVVDGCTIVSNPTPTNFTNCPGVTFTGDLSGINLRYANLAGALFFPFSSLSGADLSNANLSSAGLAADFSNANLTSANLTNAALVGCAVLPRFAECFSADLTGANLSGANFTGAYFTACSPPPPFGGGVACGAANLNGTLLVPSPTTPTVTATNNAGAVVTWPAAQSLPGATPGPCTPASGSLFLVGTTTVSCPVFDDHGGTATGTFSITVNPAKTTCTTLAGCNLSGLDLSNADFSFHDLQGANLMGANLSGANLLGANLQGANLMGANLSRAILAVANLSGANLKGTNLSGANFFLGSLTSTTNLKAVMWANTFCPDGTNSNNDGGTCINNLQATFP